MSIISLQFIAFIIITFLVYYLTPGKYQWIVLLVSSVFFYCTYGAAKIVLLLIPSIIAYVIGLLIDKIRTNEFYNNTEKKKKARPVCTVGVVLCLLFLLYAKVGHYILEGLQTVFANNTISLASIIIPLGISYYSFSLISYIIDVYRGKDEAEKNIFRFILYVVYFPKILQGPISRHQFLRNSLYSSHRFNGKVFFSGIELMLWGFFKKLVIADRLAVIVGNVWGNVDQSSGLVVLIACFFSMFQLYCDFSGCMDIFGGFSSCLGIDLEKNFVHPFFSETAGEFWRRWHITLGTWFKDYIFMPISISKHFIKFVKKIREKIGIKTSRVFVTVFPIMVVWILTGLWHNVSPCYILWGLYWGIILSIETLWNNGVIHTRRAKAAVDTNIGVWLRRAKVMVLFFISRLITSPDSLKTTAAGISRLFTAPFKSAKPFFDLIGLNYKNLLVGIIGIIILFTVEIISEKRDIQEVIEEKKMPVRCVIYFALFFSIIIFGHYGMGYDAASFVYMGY